MYAHEADVTSVFVRFWPTMYSEQQSMQVAKRGRNFRIVIDKDRVGYMHDHSVLYRSLMFKAGVMDHDAALTCFHCDSAGAIRRTKEKDDNEGDEEDDLRYLFF